MLSKKTQRAISLSLGLAVPIAVITNIKPIAAYASTISTIGSAVTKNDELDITTTTGASVVYKYADLNSSTIPTEISVSNEPSFYKPSNSVYSEQAIAFPQNWTNGSSITFNNISYSYSNYNNIEDIIDKAAVYSNNGNTNTSSGSQPLTLIKAKGDTSDGSTYCSDSNFINIFKQADRVIKYRNVTSEYYAYFKKLYINMSGTFERPSTTVSGYNYSNASYNSANSVFYNGERATDNNSYIDNVNENNWVLVKDVILDLKFASNKLYTVSRSSCSFANTSYGNSFYTMTKNTDGTPNFTSATNNMLLYFKNEATVKSDTDSTKTTVFAQGILWATNPDLTKTNQDISSFDSGTVKVGDQIFTYNPFAKTLDDPLVTAADKTRYKTKTDLISKVKAWYSDPSNLVNGVKFIIDSSNNVSFIVPVDSVALTGQDSIDVKGGDIQLGASVLPTYASLKSIEWSIIDGNDNGIATIDSGTGKVTATKKGDGTITVQAKASDGSNIVYGTKQISLNNQTKLVESDITDFFSTYGFTVFTNKAEIEAALNTEFPSASVTVSNFQSNRTNGDVIFTATIKNSIASVTVDISGSYQPVGETSEAKQSLLEVIDNAVTTMAAVKISNEDGDDINEENKWVTQHAYDELKSISDMAKKIYLNSGSTDDDCINEQAKLEDAIEIFRRSQKYGTYTIINNVEILGNKQVLGTLTVVTYNQKNEKITSNLSYNWYRAKNENDTVWQKMDTDSASYKLQGIDRNYYIKVEVQYRDSLLSSWVKTSEAVGPIIQRVGGSSGSGGSGSSGSGGSNSSRGSDNSSNSLTETKNNQESVASTSSGEIINSQKPAVWQKVNDKWYLINSDGTMRTGWQQDNGKWYYLNQSGDMKIGWFKDIDSKWYYLGQSGDMKTGWFRDIDDKWYYLKENGAMAVNEYINGYYVGYDGAWKI